MRKLLKIMASIWLAISLASAPLQALTAQPDQSGSGPCQMQSGDTGPSSSDCPHCGDKSCGSDTCTHKTCTSYHMQPISISTGHMLPVYLAEAFRPALSLQTSSRSFPPLIRPPA